MSTNIIEDSQDTYASVKQSPTREESTTVIDTSVKVERPNYCRLPGPMVKSIMEIVKRGDIDALKLELEAL